MERKWVIQYTCALEDIGGGGGGAAVVEEGGAGGAGIGALTRGRRL
jgi:hypothetical protein